ncbi:MAG: hypothetical protein BM562_04240 [Alphaproteobacteria bacterium MedPE-SWcel]|nr:MAG: hypothetical protein BM562_04240 [Alphaproteobacteria bacterium MedPE-SWcel]
MNALKPYPTPLSSASFHILPREEAVSDTLVIFFGAKDLGDASFNFFQLGRELPEHVIFVNNGVNDWYQYGIPELGETFEACVEVFRSWAEVLGVRKICCVGTSMGGWGAMRYGAALGARVLAFSSDVVFCDEASRSRAYFTGPHPVACADLREVLNESEAQVTFVIGERDPIDLYAASLLTECAGVEVISLVGCGHFVPPHLSREGRLGPLLRSFIAGAALPVAPDRGNLAHNKSYTEAIYAAQKAVVCGEWQRVAEHAEAALEHARHGEAAEVLLGRARIKLGDYAGAVGPLTSAAISDPPTDPEARVLLATAWRRAGALERSAQLSMRILTQNPGNARAHYNLALLAKANGLEAKARAYVEASLRREPGNKHYRAFLTKLNKAEAKNK